MRSAHSRERWWLAAWLGVLGLALWLSAVPAAFTVDDCNYLSSAVALRHGGVSVPGTGGLTPSRELLPFEPVVKQRVVEHTPVSPSVPPLYAPFALLVWPFGWRGLILLNVLAFVAIGWLVFELAKRHARTCHAPWVAVAAFTLGGFSLDYAQGVWPQMLSAALTTAAVWLSLRARDGDRLRWALVAGLLVGLAAGMRYQNIVFAAALGLTLLVWSKRRGWTSAAFAAGVALPAACASLINSVRLGSFNPYSKGAVYLESTRGRAGMSPLLDGLMTLWVRLVDYSAHPPFSDPFGQATLPKDPRTGVFLVVGGLKKAVLQSAPWALVAFVVLLLAWLPSARLPPAQRRLLRVLAVLAGAVLALFAWAGLERHDGWGFNQRYLLELVPLFAVALALAVDDWTLDRSALVVGAAVGIAVAAVPLAVAPEQAFRQRMLMMAPLVLAAALGASWWAAVAVRDARFVLLRAGALAACLGWALAVHVGDDMRWARALRDYHRFQYDGIAAHLPDGRLGLLVYSGRKLGTCNLYFDHDIVILDTFADAGRTASALVGELLGTGRRVFVVGPTPAPILQSIFASRRFRLVTTDPFPIGEVLSRRTESEAGPPAAVLPAVP